MHRPDRSPSQRFRFEQYLKYLQEEYDCNHVYLLNEKNDRVYYSKGKVIQKVFILIKSIFILLKHTFLKKYDLSFVQREAFMLGSSFFERHLAKRSRLIYDFDDAIWKQQIGENRSQNKFLYFLKNPDKTRDMIRAAHMVFAGNNYLADFALKLNNNVKLIPTTIDTEIYKLLPERNPEKVCIGWTGSFSTIIYFELVVDALKEVKAKYGENVYFKVIGDDSYFNDTLNIKGIKWYSDKEIDELSEIDIGLMPLPDDEWTKGKCALKGLQYMALGIPAIMSPVGVNSQIIIDGENGFLARTKEEWVNKISMLIEDKNLRRNVGLQGNKVVEEQFSVNANKDLYLKYFREVSDSSK